MPKTHAERRSESPTERRTERSAPRTEQVDGVDVVVEEMSAAAAAGFGKLSVLLGEQAVKCMIRRRNDDTKKWDFQETVPVEDFSFEMVRDVFGGGEYQVQAMDESGDFVKSFTFNIDKRYIGKRWTENQPSAGGNGGGNDAPMMVLVRGMLEELKAIRATPLAQPKEAPDPMVLIKGIAEVARSMVPPPPPPAPPPMDLEKQLGIIEKVVGVGTSILDARGGGGEMSSGDMYTMAMMKVADPIIEIVKDKISADRERRNLPRRPQAPALTAGAAPNPPTPAAEDNTMIPPWALEIRRLIPIILSRANRGASAEHTAYFVLDDLSEATKDKIADMIEAESFDKSLMQYLPPQALPVVKMHPEWFQEFLVAMNSYLFEEQPEPEPEPASGELLKQADELLEQEPATGPEAAPAGDGDGVTG